MLSIRSFLSLFLLTGVDGFLVVMNPSHSVARHVTVLRSETSDDKDSMNSNLFFEEPTTRRGRIRRRVKQMVRKVSMPLTLASPVAEVLSDATYQAVDMAVDEFQNLRIRRTTTSNNNNNNNSKSTTAFNTTTTTSVPTAQDFAQLMEATFIPIEEQLDELERAIQTARDALARAKAQAQITLQVVQEASLESAIEGAVELVAENRELVVVDDEDEQEELAWPDDIDFGTSEMAPPFLDEDQCLVPGEPLVRVERAPENSRRIFAGIDIQTSVDSVWNILTDYANLQNVVPNLVVNEVLEEFDASRGNDNTPAINDDDDDECAQCRALAQQMKGSVLRQVGGAKIAGLQFSARTTLEVREWPEGIPDLHDPDDRDWTQTPLQRHRFPRPFAVSQLPTRDISMQSIENDTGEFRLYQGVWRMQPLPGCAPPGQEAMRLTYAVEVSPRPYLPVRLVQGRIVADLCTNLQAIREYAENASQP